MSEVETSIDIAASPEEVWTIAMDPDRLVDWVTIHRHLHDHSGGRLRRGYEMEQTLNLRGVNFKVHWELVRCEHPFHAEWHGRGPARSHAETEYRLTAVASRIAAAIAGEDPALIEPLMGSLGSDLLPRDDRAAALFGVRRHGFEAAVDRALREWEDAEEIAGR